ncbi:hypothetical protein BCR39DRAFT_516221 [Naematelia encephala]|uniref:TATA box binding protein associated factor (TAF) histone-like fold domain-containing protein n=1 Tax=Naematelia encephala TaxID=71784 RepID=A0A1Y2BLK8_9TREE|nr:hypothetical protein BCR39DRAFT_516221 [Naematelia encephala]
MTAPATLGIYPTESVQEVASSLPLDPLTPAALTSLAADIEYRLHLITQEAKKFMVHAKRGTLRSEDIDHALEALNVEPILIPPAPLSQPEFVPVSLPSSSSHSSNAHQPTIYHVPDDEIDFSTYLKQPLPPGVANSAGVKWKAHWLAVEGIQPAIAENPAPKERPSSTQQPTTGAAALGRTAKSHLPQELQLYFSRLTSALVPSLSVLPQLPGQPNSDGSLPDAERHRLAALASLRSDAAIAGILVYLVKWFADSLQKCLMSACGTIGCLVDGVEALLENESIFVEPYLHQILPPLMSVILTVPLGPHPPSGEKGLTPFELRSKASQVLGKVAKQYGSTYPGLLPRLTSTLTRTLESSPFPSPLGASTPPSGRYEGAILGLSALGPHAVRTAIWGTRGDPLRRLDDLAFRLYPGQRSKPNLIKAGVKALTLIVRPKPEGWTGTVDTQGVESEFGANWARGVEKRPWLASELLRMRRQGEEEGGVRGDMDVDTPR